MLWRKSISQNYRRRKPLTFAEWEDANEINCEVLKRNWLKYEAAQEYASAPGDLHSAEAKQPDEYVTFLSKDLQSFTAIAATR